MKATTSKLAKTRKVTKHTPNRRSLRMWRSMRSGIYNPRKGARAAFYETLSMLRYSRRTGKGNTSDLTNYGRHACSPEQSLAEFAPLA